MEFVPCLLLGFTSAMHALSEGLQNLLLSYHLVNHKLRCQLHALNAGLVDGRQDRRVSCLVALLLSSRRYRETNT